MENKNIVIASVLKPLNDTRMFEKMAVSLAKLPGMEVHVIGFPSPFEVYPHIQGHRLHHFTRLSFRRLIARLRILRLVFRLKPAVLIITTHELLSITVFLRIFTRVKVVYDVQENYFLNILYTNAFPRILRPLIASLVRLKEIMTSPFLHHFLLAEAVFAKELPFTGKRFTILENKVRRTRDLTDVRRTDDEVRLLFSGTLAESTGVFAAIEIAVKLHAMEPRIRLTLIGYCSQPGTLARIQNTIEPYPFIRLVGGAVLVLHSAIMDEVERSHFGIIAYKPSPANTGRVPTKLYEYLGAKLPILLTDHAPWAALCEPYAAAITFDPRKISGYRLLEGMRTHRFYVRDPEHVFWEAEERKLIGVVEGLLEKSKV